MTSEVKVIVWEIIENIDIDMHAKFHDDPLNSFWENEKNV